MTPKEVAQLLAKQAQSVAEMLLPNGKRDGNHWRVGSVEGETGKSLAVILSGEKAGRWKDFADEDRHGDLIDLFMHTQGITLADAIKAGKDWLGIRDEKPKFSRTAEKKYRKPERPKNVHTPEEHSAGGGYLVNERGISLAAMKAYQIAERSDEIVFPSKFNGELISIKYLKIHRDKDGKKNTYVEKDCQPCLFGWQAIPNNARTVVITEGEIDAMSYWDYGYPALSVPFGGGAGDKQRWIEYEFENLDRFDEIYLSLDMDEQGNKAAMEIMERLGRHRCRLIRLPDGFKDANDLTQHGMKKEKVSAIVSAAVSLDPDELRSAADFVDDVIAEFYPPEGEEPGFCMPWDHAKWLRFRPGELVVFSGVNGHGKSQAVCMASLEAISYQWKACIASLELRTPKLLKRMTRQAAGMAEPSILYIRQIHEWYGDRLWIYDNPGAAKKESLLEVFTYARRRYGINLFIIDSLMMCGIREDDYAGQKEFVEKLMDWKLEHNVTLFLVTHSRKSESETKPGDKWDVKGSGGITDLADTVITVWRNKGKEKQVEELGEELAETQSASGLGPDSKWIVSKQRNGEQEGEISLAWDQASFQYMAHSYDKPRPFVQFSQPARAA